jgi:hypothetical protein
LSDPEKDYCPIPDLLLRDHGVLNAERRLALNLAALRSFIAPIRADG